VKVLLDENVPRNLAALLPNHEVTTVTDKGWSGLSNGELLDAAERESLDVFVTGDKTIQYEQNIAGRKLAVLSLSTNNWPIIKNYVDQIAAAINVAQSGSFSRVDVGVFSRRRSPRGRSLG
jgi:predicted nuclease of predicted toxin-antitoxin system